MKTWDLVECVDEKFYLIQQGFRERAFKRNPQYQMPLILVDSMKRELPSALNLPS